MYVERDSRWALICIHTTLLLITTDCVCSILRGYVERVEQQTCYEVQFEDGSVCDSLPSEDLVQVLHYSCCVCHITLSTSSPPG